MKMPIPIETVPVAPASRYADQPLTLRTRFMGMGTTVAACAAIAVIGLWQASAPTPTVSDAPALSVMNVAPLAAPPAAPTDKPSGEPQEEQERASKPQQQQPQAELQPAPLPASVTPPIQRVAAANALELASSPSASPDTMLPSNSAAASGASSKHQEPVSPQQQASAPPASNAPTARVASAERDRWESQVLAALNRVKHYPREASRLRQEGVSWICITMDQRGKVRDVRLHKQSGHRVLDQEALAMATRASPLPRPPAAVKALRVEVTVPVTFSMDSV